MALQITVTDAGRAEQTAGAIEITAIGLGSGKYTTDPIQTTMQSETKRLNSVSGLVISDDTIHITIKDESDDIYAVSEIGLYTASGTLFAIYSDQVNDFIEKLSGSTLMLSVDIKLSNIDVANISFGSTEFTNPQASETVSGVLKLSDTAIALEGTDDLTAMTPKKVHEAFNQFGVGRPVDKRTFDCNLLPINTLCEIVGNTSANSPSNVSEVFFINTIKGAISGSAMQIAYGLLSKKTYIRGVPGTWKEISPIASETVAGVAEVATQEETDTGKDDTRFLTPKKMRWGFSASLASNGYIVLPTWMGGLILQWGRNAINGSGTFVNYPITFPNDFLLALAIPRVVTSVAIFINPNTPPTTSTILFDHQGSGDYDSHWFAIGY